MSRPVPLETAAQMYRLANDGMAPKDIARRTQYALSTVYRVLQQEERRTGKRAARPVRGKTPTKGWSGGQVKTESCVCLCDDCVRQQPWRATLRRRTA